MIGEPKRNASIDSLVDYVADRVQTVLENMRARGFDPVVFEAKRTPQRQRWLYSFGRSGLYKRFPPRTWTLDSYHLTGKAADIISKRRRWNWPEFYEALAYEAHKVGMKTISKEGCHIEWS